MKKVVLTYGLISGLIVTGMLLVSIALRLDNLDYEFAELTGYATMIMAFSLIFLAIRSYRDNYLNGKISFGKAFQVGLCITLLASALYVTGWMVYTSVAGNAVMEEMYRHSVADLKASGLPQTEIDAQLKQMEGFREMYKNPFVKIGVTFLEIFPVGLAISLVAAFIMKRKNGTLQQVAA